MKDLFKKHIENKLEYVRQLLNEKAADSLIIDAGLPEYYFLDDQTVPFRPNPHFLHYCPDLGPGHVLQINKSDKPTLFYYAPDDFWHEVPEFDNPFWSDFFEIKIINDQDLLWKSLNLKASTNICVTPRENFAKKYGVTIADPSFISALHWSRIEKTEYEIHCLKEANKIAALGHLAARDAFLEGMSERQTFQAYLKATNQFQFDLPYGNIIAFNEKSAILHYQNSRDFSQGSTFLIDAGARFNGYCSDITRTYFTEKAHPIFKEIVSELGLSQQSLCQMVKPGNDYPEIHEQAHEDIAQILINKKVIVNTDVDGALDMDLTSTFYPHGIGHALGIQVHDVGGKQLNEQGDPCEQNEKYPFLRTLRKIHTNDVLTIEPGIYFIPMLLKNIKDDAKTSPFINWSLVDELIPFGGVRIEDDLVARKEGPENLTRPFLPK